MGTCLAMLSEDIDEDQLNLEESIKRERVSTYSDDTDGWLGFWKGSASRPQTCSKTLNKVLVMHSLPRKYADMAW